MDFQLKRRSVVRAATAATQIEGGDLGHNWNDWLPSGSDQRRFRSGQG